MLILLDYKNYCIEFCLQIRYIIELKLLGQGVYVYRDILVSTALHSGVTSNVRVSRSADTLAMAATLPVVMSS